MADILICKGKHINKLTGTDRQINKLNDAIKGFEKHQEANNKHIQELYAENKTLREELKQAEERLNPIK